VFEMIVFLFLFFFGCFLSGFPSMSVMGEIDLQLPAPVKMSIKLMK